MRDKKIKIFQSNGFTLAFTPSQKNIIYKILVAIKDDLKGKVYLATRL